MVAVERQAQNRQRAMSEDLLEAGAGQNSGEDV